MITSAQNCLFRGSLCIFYTAHWKSKQLRKTCFLCRNDFEILKITHSKFKTEQISPACVRALSCCWHANTPSIFVCFLYILHYRRISCWCLLVSQSFFQTSRGDLYDPKIYQVSNLFPGASIFSIFLCQSRLWKTLPNPMRKWTNLLVSKNKNDIFTGCTLSIEERS